MTGVRSVYLDVAPDPVFAMVHEPDHADAAAGLATGVLIVPPFGWNDIASYRSRRAWAMDLAAHGHRVLRLDLPGSGDSGGRPADPARVDAWVAAVDAAVRWLRAQPGTGRVAVIGLAAGGLVAARAAETGAPMDDLVLWATPASGRSMVRQERAFAAMQADRYSLTGEPEPRLVPDDWLEVNGFLLSAETMADLAAIDLTAVGSGSVQRALLLETDGLAMDGRVADHLAAAGVATEQRPGPGWGVMTSHPERTEPPLETMATVAAWLAAAPAMAPADAAGTLAGAPATAPVALVGAPLAHDAATIATEDGLVRESPVWVQVGTTLRFGILAEPEAVPGDARPSPALGALFMNAGAVRRVGPNRLWVETARRWAARGVPSLRLDLEGIGDADGDGSIYREVARFYEHERLAADIRAGIDLLEARGIGPRIALVGLCAGGYHAANGALGDARVTAAILLNPGALVWDHGLVGRRDAGKLRRLLQPTWWVRLARGKVRRERIAAVARAVVRTRVPSVVRPPVSTSVDALLDGLRDRDIRVDLAFSTDEALEHELEAAGVLGQAAARWPNIRRHRLPGRDHTLRPLVAQAGAHAVLDAALERELARAARTAAPDVPGLVATAFDGEAVR